MHLLAAIPPPPGNVIDIGPLTIHYYGIALATGAMLGASWTRRRYVARGGDPALADRVAVWAIVAGFIGARLAYVSTHLDRFLPGDPLGMLRVWEGGLAFFGGLTFGAVTAILLVRRWGGSVPHFADAAAPAIPLAQAFGRWGNYFNQELYGTSTDLPWALQIERGGQIVDTVHPTFLYEMLGNLLIVGALLLVERRRSLRAGSLMFVYAMGYGVLRFCTELIRTDTTFRIFGISRNGWVAVLILLLGIAGLVWRNRGPQPVRAEDADGGGTDGEAVGDDDAEEGEEPVAQPAAASSRDADPDPAGAVEPER
jgi:prolipoprotein diacylglyceryl transferase